MHMCDALASNMAGDFDTVLCHCLAHGRRKVIDVLEHFPERGHLPEELHASVGHTMMREAWDSANPELAKKQLQRLPRSLQSKHPGAAASLREGLEETLTVQVLGITGALYRTLRTTNPIEKLNGSIAHYTRNVKRWRDRQMTLRGSPAPSATPRIASANCAGTTT